MQEMQVYSLGQEDCLEKETNSSIFTWRMPWTIGAWQATVHWVPRVEHDLVTKLPSREPDTRKS